MSWTNIVLLLGGLGFFLYGMKLMSDGLEKVAGTKMRNVLALCTKNRFTGLVVGFLFTAVIQSSSAATVMVVSFVNSGLMTLLQSVGVIMGANIGTTITGQLITFDFGSIAPIFIMLGVVMIMFFKSQIVKKIGEVILGFGVLFYGMQVMTNSMSVLGESDAFHEIIGSLSNPFLAVLVGFVITGILQSSSATIGILIGMAAAGLVDLPICLYLTLGCNMGSCLSAVIASISGKKDGKRAALIHLIFNIFGSIALIAVLLPFGDWFCDVIMSFSRDTAKGVANAHTIFKIVQTIILFPFGRLLVKMTNLLIPGEDKEAERFELKYIGAASPSPSTVIFDVNKEIQRMGMITKENLELSVHTLISPNLKEIQKVLETEKQIDYLSKEITNYLVSITQSMLPIDEVKNIAAYFHVVNDFERIGDHAENLAEFAQLRLDENIVFSQAAIAGLQCISDKVIEAIEYAIDIFPNENEEIMKKILMIENEVDALEDQLQDEHIKRLTTNGCSPKSVIYSDILSNLERVSDHAFNIASAIHKPWEA